MPNKNFIISRIDSIGDVVLTLPMAGILKEKFPNCKVYFLCQNYTRPIVECCVHVDEILDWYELQKTRELNLDVKNTEIIHVFPHKDVAKFARRAKIRTRTGTTNRWYHWLFCNVLIPLSRKKSDLHEAQLNLKLLQKHIGKETISLEKISEYLGFENIPELPQNLCQYLQNDKFNLILHPKSKGSAQEWGLENFNALIGLLPPQKYNILVTGTEKEGELFRHALHLDQPHVTDVSGKMNLSELISLIQAADGLIACSTGPLHIAAVLNKTAIGLYPGKRPMHAGRWAPLGKNVKILSAKNPEMPLESIMPEEILEALN